MEKEIIKTEHNYGRALLDNKTFNKEQRTIEVVFATETPVKRYSWRLDGYFNEVLEVTTNAMNTERLDTGSVPVLDSHNRWDLSSQIGVVEKAWIDEEKREARALLRLSGREDIEGIIKDIEEGIIRNISVGYSVEEYTVDKEKELHEYRATKWTPTEISFVTVPADHKSGTRSQDKEKVTTVLIHKREKMDEQTPTTQEQAKPQHQPQPEVNVEQARKEAVEAERKRVAAINELIDSVRNQIPDAETLRSAWINEGISIETANERALKEIAKNANKPPVTVSVGDEKQTLRQAMEIGLAARALPGRLEEIKGNEKAQQFRNLRMIDFAKECLRAANERADYLSDMEVVKRAFATTDFPDLLTATFNRTLNRFYTGVVPDWKMIARQENVSDFRKKTGINVDNAVTFEEIAEGGEYKSADLLYNEKVEIGVKKFGRKYSITDKAIINDDLSVFSRLPQIMAIGAQRFQSEKVWGLIASNAKAPDNKAIFHADHFNLASPGAALTETSLSAARLAIRKQVAPGSGLRLGLTPTYLIVPADLETTAQKLLSAVLATATDDVNVFAGKLQLIVSDALTDTKAWYLMADPSQSLADGLVYSYLNGHEGLEVESRVNFDTDALEIKGRLFFDAAVWGYQPWYKNPGA